MAGRKIGVSFDSPTVYHNIPLVGPKLSTRVKLNEPTTVERFRVVLPHISLISFCTVYVLFGAWMFCLVEYPAEERLKMEAKKDFKDDYERFQVLLDTNFSSDLEMEKAMNEYLDESAAMRFGWWENHYTEETQWSYGNSVFFCISMLTTIGYGTVTPLTTTGRVLSMMYGIFGVPLMLITVADIGMFISEAFRQALKTVRIYIGKEDNLPYFVITGLLVIYLALGTMIMCYSDDGHSILDSFYWAFITMTSIGFGDIVPEGVLSKILIGVYMVIGIAITSMCIEQSGAFYIHKVHYFGRKILRASTITDVVNYARLLRRRQGLMTERIDDDLLERLRKMAVTEIESIQRNSIQPPPMMLAGAFEPDEINRFRFIDQSRGMSVASSRTTRKNTICIPDQPAFEEL